jgi:hypothetical protein
MKFVEKTRKSLLPMVAQCVRKSPSHDEEKAIWLEVAHSTEAVGNSGAQAARPVAAGFIAQVAAYRCKYLKNDSY